MARVFFAPFSIVAGLLAGFAGKKLFERIWAQVDHEADGPPEPKEPGVSWAKLISGLAIQGAIFTAVRGVFDHAARRSFARATGIWPGKRSD